MVDHPRHYLNRRKTSYALGETPRYPLRTPLGRAAGRFAGGEDLGEGVQGGGALAGHGPGGQVGLRRQGHRQRELRRAAPRAHRAPQLPLRTPKQRDEKRQKKGISTKQLYQRLVLV